jgi:hypothetical protein
MNRLVKLHAGLTRYLINELPKKKNLREAINFLKPLLGVYLKELLKLYKGLFLIFDKEYQKQKKQFDKMQRIKVDLNRALKILQYIDKKMVDKGNNRQEIRQFWLDFTKNGQVRQDIFDELLKDINQIR